MEVIIIVTGEGTFLSFSNIFLVSMGQVNMLSIFIGLHQFYEIFACALSIWITSRKHQESKIDYALKV